MIILSSEVSINENFMVSSVTNHTINSLEKKDMTFIAEQYNTYQVL